MLKPTDNIICRIMASYQAAAKANTQVASKVRNPEGRACNRKAKTACVAEI